MTTQQGRDNQSSTGDHRKPRVPSPEVCESAEPCNLARCGNSGKTGNGFGGFTRLWCLSKPACCRLVAPLVPNDAMHCLAAPGMRKRTAFFLSLEILNLVFDRAVAAHGQGIVAPRHDGTAALPFRSSERSGRIGGPLAKRIARPPGALQATPRPPD